MAAVDLRPHHALCALFFRGKGYSDGFVRNMGEVLELLQGDCTVRIIVGPDRICGACPNLDRGACVSPKPGAYDERAMGLMGLVPGQELSAGELRELALEKVINAGKLRQVCGDCQWAGYCG